MNGKQRSRRVLDYLKGLLCLFGLTGAPVAWQRGIIHLLRDYLDEFCTAYLDDMLIWSDGEESDHLKEVDLVLEKLVNAGLKLDIKKSDFAVKEPKYLRFVVTAGKGISVDSEKKKTAIEKCECPKTQTAVRSFLWFASFYRNFIDNFVSLSAPLQRYTKKQFSGNERIQLDHEARKTFEKLKEQFVTSPILALFDPDQYLKSTALDGQWELVFHKSIGRENFEQ